MIGRVLCIAFSVCWVAEKGEASAVRRVEMLLGKDQRNQRFCLVFNFTFRKGYELSAPIRHSLQQGTRYVRASVRAAAHSYATPYTHTTPEK